ncbi:MAG: DUF4924 family protein [Rikenellaceae bacterium]
MDTAQSLRRTNIAEYILYLWQLEDMFRALQFSPEAIYSQFVAPRTSSLDQESCSMLLTWYMELVQLLQKEGKEEKGHIEHSLHLIADLHNLHLQLLELPIGARYRTLVARLAEVMPDLRALFGSDVSDTELAFRALYAAMLYRIKGDGGKGAVVDTIEYISPVIAELSSIYGKVERGEVDLFKNSDAE